MKTKKIFSLLIISTVLILFTVSLFLLLYQKNTASAKIYSAAPHSSRNTNIESRGLTEKLTIGAIGDILIHDWVYEDAFKNGKYDFKPMLTEVKPLLQSPDILVANQETVLGGAELGVSSYPMFNSPTEVGDAFVDAGVDIVTNANNHSLDKGERGVQSAIRYYEKKGLPYVGSFKNFEDQQKLRIIRKNGIKLAFLSYTYGTNGIPVPEGKGYLVNLIDREKMKNEIHRARKEADVVIMALHWGNEYQRVPTNEQKELGQFVIDEGVDIIFGHHPHVLQPMEWAEAADGRKAFIVYSLGNFLSGQMRDYKDIGGIATLEITKTISKNERKIELSNPVFIPTYVENKNLKNYRVLPLEKAGSVGAVNATVKNNEILDHMLQWLP
ncbi:MULTISPECIES: CapA family protein [unclassified Bacillus (in: firmicutes)]|uniref:CapA family protein n=1 Tax=unclassified Bacillus (in: firmicutes) TaxID=185979 RepID=UPI0008DF92A0|nr:MULTISPECIES: CapA family protein [unclassified Bacillus (in: firmicutes)]SFA89132.1 poly-gamma-glutamate synthesis protein (capsule biosynthesis protein) [Bacillus sp. UNCCL13]SFQ84801.1 poly-gamma-glutamate synthesis protein (capsule biosynthesis protein) [Bacillus sp. cl95]